MLVQDPNEAEHSSMPRNAISMEVADFVKPVGELAIQVFELLQQNPRYEILAEGESDEDTLRRILAHVRVRLGHDFSSYKRATIVRRIARRSQVTHQDSLASYYAYLRENPEEAQALFSDFLISVTTFFRDYKAFEALAKKVIPLLFDDKSRGSAVRVWVPGCATGEEAYSIGMLLLEEAARRDFRPEIQVFGSDLDAGALGVAREGRYPASIEADVSEERLQRFFEREGEHYHVRRELREIVLFANHSLLRDPPFSRLNLISCRNLLIYMDRELQQQVCNTFHYALNVGGFLFLGASESADQPNSLFRPLDRDAKIYRSVLSSGERISGLPMLLGPRREQMIEATIRRTPPRSEPTVDAVAHSQMLERVAPPSMLVDVGHRAVHLSEGAGRYLQLTGGSVSNDATELVRPELRFDLRTALHRAFERGEPTLSMPIFVKFDGHARRVYLQVRPVAEDHNTPRHALVMFIEGEEVNADSLDTTGQPVSGEPTMETIRRLQDELQLSQSRLRATRKDSEIVNEELRAANEELQSVNEEYRSTSEELETSKEELQSINEELQTVNNELKLKLESVSRAHSDLQNLLAATDVGTLFLDTGLRIKRFTPRLAEIFNVTVNDEGRPITDFTHQLEYDGLAGDAKRVLKELGFFEHEVKSRIGNWYLVRIRPYRTVDDRIDGVVITFVDITERLRAEEALRSSERRLKQEMQLVELSRSPMFVWDFDDGIVQWNRGSEQVYGFSRKEAIGKRIEDILKSTFAGGTREQVREALLRDGSWSGELVRTCQGRTSAGGRKSSRAGDRRRSPAGSGKHARHYRTEKMGSTPPASSRRTEPSREQYARGGAINGAADASHHELDRRIRSRFRRTPQFARDRPQPAARGALERRGDRCAGTQTARRLPARQRSARAHRRRAGAPAAGARHAARARAARAGDQRRQIRCAVHGKRPRIGVMDAAVGAKNQPSKTGMAGTRWSAGEHTDAHRLWRTTHRAQPAGCTSSAQVRSKWRGMYDPR